MASPSGRIYEATLTRDRRERERDFDLETLKNSSNYHSSNSSDDKSLLVRLGQRGPLLYKRKRRVCHRKPPRLGNPDKPPFVILTNEK